MTHLALAPAAYLRAASHARSLRVAAWRGNEAAQRLLIALRLQWGAQL